MKLVPYRAIQIPFYQFLSQSIFLDPDKSINFSYFHSDRINDRTTAWPVEDRVYAASPLLPTPSLKCQDLTNA
jgi:hypothetical protein